MEATMKANCKGTQIELKRTEYNTMVSATTWRGIYRTIWVDADMNQYVKMDGEWHCINGTQCECEYLKRNKA